MQPEIRQLLVEMRSKANQGDWTIGGTLQSIVSHIDYLIALDIGVHILSEYLPIFEKQHPNIHWAKEVLETVGGIVDGKANTIPHQVFPEELENLVAPGSNSFLKSVELLQRAVSSDRSQYAHHISEAISERVMSSLINFWGMLHQEEWGYWINGISSGKSIIVIGFSTDAEVTQRFSEEWLGIANKLESRLSAIESQP